MKQLLIILLFGLFLYLLFDGGRKESGDLDHVATTHDKVIMYALTTCGYCKQKAKDLEEAGIRYIEYFIDKDRRRRDELHAKLDKAGFPPRSYGTPIMDVHGVMLPNNPSMSKILAAMGQ